MEVRVNFDKNKLSVVKPSTGISIIGVWVEPPCYDNSRGIASYVGVIPNGIVTESGLVGTITFKAKSPGRASVSFSSNSKILLNDGLGTASSVEFGRADYNILHKAPLGINVYSETHTFQSEWYNNNSPVVSWDKEDEVEGFSFVLDNRPMTIPKSSVNTSDTTTYFENLQDGIWYFHIKANKNGVWGATSHFLLRIDTTPPASFKPDINYLLATAMFVERALVSFFTTDNLSGIDRYEVGLIDKGESTTVSPVFIESESPFQIPLRDGSKEFRVIVRAIDYAGNIREESIDVSKPSTFGKFLSDNILYILLFIIFVGLTTLILHYLFGHHIIKKYKRFIEMIRKEEKIESGDTEKNSNDLNSPLPPA